MIEWGSIEETKQVVFYLGLSENIIGLLIETPTAEAAGILG